MEYLVAAVILLVVLAGIGAAMRIAPAALYFADDPDAMHDAVINLYAHHHKFRQHKL